MITSVAADSLFQRLREEDQVTVGWYESCFDVGLRNPETALSGDFGPPSLCARTTEGTPSSQIRPK